MRLTVWLILVSVRQEQWKQQGAAQAERAVGSKSIPRTLSVGESGRSSATLGTSSVEEWLQQAARQSEDNGDSPASRLQFQLMQGGALFFTHAGGQLLSSSMCDLSSVIYCALCPMPVQIPYRRWP